MEPIRVGDKVKIVRHDVLRRSPYKGKIGTVNFVPPDGNWPYIVSVPNFTAALGPDAARRRLPWPSTFGRHEIEKVTQ